MLRIDRDILNIDQVICSNIDLIDFENVTRALVAQNLLSYSRNLVEHIAVKLYGIQDYHDKIAEKTIWRRKRYRCRLTND